MAYTKEQISLIHGSGTAVYNETYVDKEGNTYIGTSDGRLQLTTQELNSYQLATLNVVQEEPTTNISEPYTQVDYTVTVEDFESYFEYDAVAGVLKPIEVDIVPFIENNIFTVGLNNTISPSSYNAAYTDINMEYDVSNYIVPKSVI